MYSLKEKRIKQLTPLSIEAAKKRVIVNKIEGNSTQETRSGKNKFDYNNADFYSAQTEKVIINNEKVYKRLSSSTTSVWGIFRPNNLESNKEYTISFDIWSDIETNFAQNYIYINGSIKVVHNLSKITTQKQKLKATFTYQIADTYVHIYPVYIANNSIYISNIQIEEGKNATLYEDFGASPSPDYPSEIHSVADDVNLFKSDLENITYKDTQVTHTIDNTNRITTINSYSWARLEIKYSNLQPNTDYIISSKINNENQINCGLWGESGNADVSTNKEFISTIIKKTDNNGILEFYLYTNYSSSTTQIGTVVFDEIKIAKGTKATPYSEYGKGTLTIEQRGNNIWNEEWEQGAFQASNGNKITEASRVRNKELINVIPNSTIYYEVNSKYTSLRIACYDINKTYLGQSKGWLAPSGNKFVIPENCYYINFVVVIEEEIYDDGIIFSYSQTSYEPYFHKEYIFQTEPLRSNIEQTVKDEIINDGIHRRIRSVVLDGSDDENWAVSGKTFYSDYIKDYNKKDFVPISKYFKGVVSKSGAGDMTIDKTIAFGKLATYDRVYIKYDDITTVTQFKQWLSTHPTEVIYELAEEIIEPFTEEQQDVLDSIETKEGTNIFNLNGEIQTNLDIEYNPKLTEEIKNAFKYNTTRAYLQLPATITEPELIIDEENYLKDISFDDCRFVEGEGIIGGVVAKGLEGNFVNVDNSFNIENREIKLFIGAELDDGNIEYLKYGTFIVQRPDNNNVNDNTKFAALDYMIKFNDKYEDRVTYPCTLKKLLLDVCNQAGIKLRTKNFRNQNFIIENNQFVGGESLRQVLKAIAQIAFTWARINEDDELLLDFNVSDKITEEFDYDEYYNLDFNNEFGPINTIILRDGEVEGENYTIKETIENNQNLIDSPSGKNIFNYNYVRSNSLPNNLIPTENGLNLKQCWATDIFDFDNMIKILKPNTTYTMKAKAKVISRPSTFVSHQYNTFLLYRANTSEYGYVFKPVINMSDKETIPLNTEKEYVTTFTTPEILTDLRFVSYTFYGNNDGSTTGTAQGEIDLSDIMLIEGEYTTENFPKYEPYIPYGEKELVVSNNPFAYTQDKRQQLVQAGSELYSFRYIPTKIKTIGAIYLNCLDKIRIKNMQDEYIETYIFDNKIKYNGAISDEKETQAMTETETLYQYTGETSEAIKRTEIIVDKANQKINEILEFNDGVTQKITDIETNINGLNVSLTTSGGNNFLMFSTDFWDIPNSENKPLLQTITSSDNRLYEEIKRNSISGLGYYLMKETVEQKMILPNGKYTISFLYKTLIKGKTTKLIIDNGTKTEYLLEDSDNFTDFMVDGPDIVKEDGEIEKTKIYLTFEVKNNEAIIQFSSNENAAVSITDLMLNAGNVKLDWSQNANETITDTVKIGKGIEISSTSDDVKFKADTDGIRILYKDDENDPIAKFTRNGTETNNLLARKSANIVGLTTRKVENQIWITATFE